MKSSLIALSLVFNVIALSLFGYFVYRKGGLPYLAEKVLLTRGAFRGDRSDHPRTAENERGVGVIALNPPEISKGKPLMQALQARKSERAFADTDLTLQELSDLLWAADGINRADGRRTAPSYRNAKEFDVYVVLREGIYRYEPARNQLLPVVPGDHRRHAGRDSYVASAPVNLIYVADLAKIAWTTDEAVKLRIADLDVGFIAGNVGLFCASEGFASVPRDNIDRDALAKIMQLRPEQKIILGTTVGRPRS